MVKDPLIESYLNKHKGEHGVCLTCGPSLNDYTVDVVKECVGDKPVLFVKQAWDHYGQACLLDRAYHFFNLSNAPKKGFDYTTYGRPEVIVASNQHLDKTIKKFDYDLLCEVSPFHNRMKPICGPDCPQDLDDWLFSKTGSHRPCGPGIMYETVLYWAVHVGLSKLTVFGWDLYDLDRSVPSIHKHFYRRNKKEVHNYLSDFDRVHVELSYHSGNKIYKWLGSHGCELELVGNKSYHQKVIPRVEI